MVEIVKFLKKCDFQLLGLEIPFSHYGERGFCDAWLAQRDFSKKTQYWVTAEIKPEIVDIGETVRQVNRMKLYFYKDKKSLLDGWNNQLLFPLIVEASESNFRTFMEYEDYFRNIDLIFFDKTTGLKNEFNQRLEIHKSILLQQKECC